MMIIVTIIMIIITVLILTTMITIIIIVIILQINIKANTYKNKTDIYLKKFLHKLPFPAIVGCSMLYC